MSTTPDGDTAAQNFYDANRITNPDGVSDQHDSSNDTRFSGEPGAVKRKQPKVMSELRINQLPLVYHLRQQLINIAI